MSEMQAIILQSAEKIFSKHVTKEVMEKAESGYFPSDLWESLQDSGLLLLGVEEKDGGNGGDAADGFKLLQLAGQYSAPIPLAETLISHWLLAETGVRGNSTMKTLSCLFKPNKMEQSVGKSQVSGMIPHVPYGRDAKTVITFMQRDEGYEFVILPVSSARIERNQNLAGEARDTLHFDELPIDEVEHYPIAAELQQRTIYLGALARVAMMTGAMETIMELTIEHVKTRQQFGRPLSRQQAIQHHIALLAGELAAAKAALQNAIVSLEYGPPTKEIALAKIRLNEGAGKFAKVAHQVMAAIGFTHEHSLHHSTRRLWSYRDEFGSETDWSNIIAKQLRQGNQNGLWEYVTESYTPKGEKNEQSTIYR
ncbi:acyl-CoA dehydrogenase family protein [Pradoshia sp.]